MKALKKFFAVIGFILTMLAIVIVVLTLVNLGACLKGTSYDNSIFITIVNLPWYVQVAAILVMIYSWLYSKHNPGKLSQTLSKMLF